MSSLLAMSLSFPLVFRSISSSQLPVHRSNYPSSIPPFHIRNPCLHFSSLGAPRAFANHYPGFKHSYTWNLSSAFIARSSGDGEQTLNDADTVGFSNEEEDARGQSTLPSRFRHLTKEVPDRPVRWPWLVALFFLVYTWRTVLSELGNWKKALVSIAGLLGYLLKLTLGIIFHFLGDPIAAFVKFIESFLYFIHSIYAGIVLHAPVMELTYIILLASTVLAIAEATVPSSIKNQSHLLTLAGLVGYGVIDGFIPALLFWPLLFGLYCFSRFIKKRENVSAVLPVAATVAAVAEPWIRSLAIVLYLALAIAHHSRCVEKAEMGTDEKERSGSNLPLPLLAVAMSIGIHIAANWVRLRHLTWRVL